MKTTFAQELKNKSDELGSPGDIIFERIWSLLIENQQKKDRYLEEIEKKFFRQMEENTRQLEESGNKFIRQMEEKRNKYIEEPEQNAEIEYNNENKKEKQQTKKRKTAKNGDSFSEFDKNLICTGITGRFDEMGYHFDDISFGGRRILDKKGNTRTEIDIILENPDCITAVKIITKFSGKNIDLLAAQLKLLREHRSKYNDKRKIYGAIAGTVIENEEKQAAVNSGIFVFEQAGVTMKTSIPENFNPHNW